MPVSGEPTTGASAQRLTASTNQLPGASLGSSSPSDSPIPYSDIPGFCKSATLEDIEEHGFVLTPGRYVGAADLEDDGEPFVEKMQRLTAELYESESLSAQIKSNLEGLGYG